MPFTWARGRNSPSELPGHRGWSPFTGKATTPAVWVFSNSTRQDWALPQDSGCLSTALEAEGTRSASGVEVSFHQIIGTCGVSGSI